MVDNDLRDVLVVVTKHQRTWPNTVANELGIPVKEARRRLRLLAKSGAVVQHDSYWRVVVPYVEVRKENA